MNIERAKQLKVGDKVQYPADRGGKAGTATVKSTAGDTNTNIHGIEYVWIGTDKGVWPSNRIN